VHLVERHAILVHDTVFGLRVWGLGLSVGFRMYGLGFGAWGVGFRVSGLESSSFMTLRSGFALGV